MYRYKKIIVPLEMTEGDAAIIGWVGKVTQLAKTREVEFLHTHNVPEIPQGLKEKYPWLMEPLDEMLQEKMEAAVKEAWEGEPGTELKFRVVKGQNTLMSILTATLEQGSDLVVVGREAFGGDMVVRLARKAPCSVMSIPQGSPVNLERITVPTDFSKYSSDALDVALAFAEAGGVKAIDSVHIYNLGRFSHRVTLPEAELKDMEAEFAEEKHKEYLAELDTRGIEVRRVDSYYPMVSTGIQLAAQELKSDLIVTGCRGHDTVTAWLLGGNAEELLKSADVPVVAAKPKGTGRKLLDALLKGL